VTVTAVACSPVELRPPLPAGCGELPEGVEMAAKLMLPGERALVVCAPQYAFRGRDDAPVGIRPEDTVSAAAPSL
jgi:hypothetical protein